MKFDLAALTRRANPGIRRRSIVIRDIAPPAVFATDLYRACYLPIVLAWERDVPALLAEYERTLSAMTTDSPADINALLGAASANKDRLFLELDAGFRDWTIKTERWQRRKWRDAALSSTNVDIEAMIGPEDARETLQSYIAWNARLIRDVSAQAEQRIGNAIYSGLQNRSPVREVAKEIQSAMAMSRTRAKGIASDQLSKVTNALADERRRQAGCDVWKWRHSGKAHPRVYHKERDGKLYADTAAGAGREVDGQVVNAPPEAKDLPGRPAYCGCRSQAVLVLD